MNTAIVTGSLHDIAAKSGQSIAVSFLSVDVVILVDVSGSMMSKDAPGEKSRYDAAVNELSEVQKTNPGKIAIISFSDDVQLCPSGIPLFESGTTNLAKALRFAKMADVGGIRFLVISDGEPNSESEALEAARTYQGEIHTIYVGSELGAGRAFLQKLATANRGTFQAAELTKMLGLSVKKCLPALNN